ncbi:MAG TPA: NAD(P)/FAD-dependent oxidoreductase [Candidatus Limnocylindrales bacterium]|nr:NAD(P)/FAD-dependent oxidoreductase [Candidatus Limnocylindrales bacterium]
MDTFDFVIIGAGPAGEAAAYMARERGASVAIVDREWFGGSCPHIGCLPSKALLYAAGEHAANPDAYPWQRASDHRDYMINRAAGAAEPDDSGHFGRLEAAGAVAYRGTARIVGRGHVEISRDGVKHTLDARNVVVAVGSVSKTPPLPGLDAIRTWTNREATLARQLPKSLLVLGGGPTGCEMAQVYARFGVPTTIVQSGERLMPTDHPRNADAVAAGLRDSGVAIRLGVRAVAARAAASRDGAHVIDLDDGSTAEGHEILLAVGRAFPLDDLGLEHYGIDTSGRTAIPRDGRLRIAEGLWVIGDPAGPELHTHQGHYQGETAVRMALGDDVTPDYRALPRATYTDPEAAFVGVTLDQARAAGIDAFELVADYATSTKGYGVEAKVGHVTIVVDRASRELVGAAMACPDATAAIHECVVAIQAHVGIDVLAETIHAFPSTSRIFNGLFADARRALEQVASGRGT